MRSFEQRIAEINRRSKEIMKQRKRRRSWALGFCVPLVSVGLCAVLLLPGGGNSGGAPEGMKEQSNLSDGSQAGSTTSPVISIRLASTQMSQSYSDPQEMDNILAVMDAILRGQQDLGDIQEESQENSSSTDATLDRVDDQTDDDGKTEGDLSKYTIRLTHEDGSLTKYTLQGFVLTDSQTQKEYTVPAAELIALRLALGIDGE